MTVSGVGDQQALVAERVHRLRWAILGVLVVSILVVTLDNTVLNVALPRIQEQLGASQSEQEWIIDAYTLAFAALLFPWGVLGDRSGRRRVLLLGLVIFGAGSAAAAHAGSPSMLIVLRTVMGLGAAAIFPATLAIITNVFEDDERARAIAIWAGFSGLALAIGPLVGGALLSAGFWWGSVFLINVPIVAAGIVGVVWLVPESHDPSGASLDARAVPVAVAGLVLVVYGLIRAGETSRWTSPVVLACLSVGVAVLVLFAWLEARSRRPALDLTWFRHPAFSAGVAAMTLVSFSLFGIMLFGTYYLQFERGYSPLRAGALLLPLALAIGVFAPLSAGLVDRFGRKTVCATGLGLVGIAMGLFGFITSGTSLLRLESLLFLLGVGMGLAMAPATTAILASLPPARAGAGSAVNSTVRQVGGALGVAVLGSVLSSVYRSQISDALTGLPAAARQAAGESIGATQILVERYAPLLPDHGAGLMQAASTAFIHATHVTATVSAAAMALAVVIVVAFMPNRSDPPPDPDTDTGR